MYWKCDIVRRGPRAYTTGQLGPRYRAVLELDLPWLDDVVRAKRPQRLPTVLTREEVRAALQPLEGVPRLMAHLLYGAGLRLLECCRLRVQDVDFASNQIVVVPAKARRTG